jgi:DNA primase
MFNHNDLADAKRRLPLPELLRFLNLSEHAKRSAKCPLHEDHSPSFSTWQNAQGAWLWKCHAGCGCGDEISFLERLYKLSRGAAIRRFVVLANGGYEE